METKKRGVLISFSKEINISQNLEYINDFIPLRPVNFLKRSIEYFNRTYRYEFSFHSESVNQ